MKRGKDVPLDVRANTYTADREPGLHVKLMRERQFERLAADLERAAGGLASPRKARTLDEFEHVLALDDIVPRAVDHLCHTGHRPVWMQVLATATGLKPSLGQDTIDAAQAAWESACDTSGLR